MARTEIIEKDLKCCSEETQKYVANLEFENGVFKARLSQNSSNSNRPPSTDIKKSIPNNREKSGKKPGGQPGREGINLEMVKNPDKTIIYKLPNICPHCLKKIVRTIMQDYEKRQEFDIPEPSPLVVTEHRAEIGLCEHCGKTIRAEFPENITAPTQYGHTIQSRAVYANQYQLIPYKRTVELLEVFFGVRISEGAIAEWNKKMYDALQPMEELIKQKIMNAPLIHADETSVRINKKLHYLHLTSTEFLTLFNLHKERSIKALMDIGILPNYSGIVVHDAYKMYFHFSFIHALCNAHNCRELKGIFQNDSLQWAKNMKEFLCNMYDEKCESPIPLSEEVKIKASKKFDEIIEAAEKETPKNTIRGDNKRGKIKQSKARNMLERCINFKDAILRFIFVFLVPFDNNQGERDFRMAKVHQKISGCFRSFEGARYFCRIRNCISTAKKNKKDVLKLLSDALAGKPILF